MTPRFRVVEQVSLFHITDELLWNAMTRAYYEIPTGHLRISPVDYSRLHGHCTRNISPYPNLAQIGGVPVVLDFDMEPGWLHVAVTLPEWEPVIAAD